MNKETAEELGYSLRAIAGAITPIGAAPHTDAAGGYVGSLTEAVMGMTAALVRVADEVAGLRASFDASPLGFGGSENCPCR